MPVSDSAVLSFHTVPVSSRAELILFLVARIFSYEDTEELSVQWENYGVLLIRKSDQFMRKV